MKKYTHLTEQERLDLYYHHRSWKSIRYIAKKLWRSPSTIGRELMRNTEIWSYYEPLKAQRWYEWKRLESNHRQNKILYDKDMQEIIHSLLQQKRSPDSIAWRMKREWCMSISTQTIYSFIYDRKQSWRIYLKYKKGYKKRGKWSGKWWLKGIRSIEERKESILARKRYGHREVDTIHGKGHKWWLVTIVERKSRYCEIGKVAYRSKDEVWSMIMKLLKKHNKQKLLTITSDNGKEFACHKDIEEELWIWRYGCHVYASYERGTNEHTNGMIRFRYPKWTDFLPISDEEVENVAYLLNRKPRKTLWYRTPYEVFFSKKLCFFSKK